MMVAAIAWKLALYPGEMRIQGVPGRVWAGWGCWPRPRQHLDMGMLSSFLCPQKAQPGLHGFYCGSHTNSQAGLNAAVGEGMGSGWAPLS